MTDQPLRCQSASAPTTISVRLTAPWQLRARAADTLARVGRHWGWIRAFGVITLAAGAAVLVWPAPSLVVVAIVFGIQLIVAGIYRFVSAFASADVAGGTRVL
jgi:uncharacterized membrane protein HdeD (DUF308 family)